MNTLEDLIEICKNNLDKTPEIKDYFLSRGLSISTIEKYNLGAFPANTSKVCQYLNKEDLIKKYIVSYNENSYFSDNYRAIFPIYNDYGEPVGISGRATISEEKRKKLKLPKYINSRYEKKDTLFGLSMAKEYVLLKDNVLIVEGFFDQIALFESGIKNCVAICGTNFSVNHLIRLRRYSSKVSFLLDNDDGGRTSMLNINKKFSRKAKLSFFCLPQEVKDAGEFIFEKKNSASNFLSAIRKIRPNDLK